MAHLMAAKHEATAMIAGTMGPRTLIGNNGNDNDDDVDDTDNNNDDNNDDNDNDNNNDNGDAC